MDAKTVVLYEKVETGCVPSGKAYSGKYVIERKIILTRRVVNVSLHAKRLKNLKR